VNSLTHKKLIKAKKMGNSLSCQLNLSSDPQLLAISSLTHSQGLLRRVRFSFLIDEIKEKLNDLIYITALFGSHAKGTAKRSSDVNLPFVVQNEKEIEKTRGKIKSVLSSTKIKIEFEIVTTEWLLKIFEEKNTVGREVLEGSIILHGAEQYYTLVRNYDQKRGH
jgi:predicted nucleotidyltransferase